MTKQKKMKKKSLVTLVVTCLLLCATALGTVAWLTASDEVVNKFTVGSITEPEVGPENPENPDPDSTDTPDVYDPDVDGNLFEPYWKDDSKLVPGYSISKDPYVGIGAKSENAYAFVNVTNNFDNNVYFMLNEGWKSVQGKKLVVGEETYYINGLFVYESALTASETDSVWTETPVFSEVIVADDATVEELTAVTDKEIKVECFLHQATDEAGTDLKTTATEAAREFYK